MKTVPLEQAPDHPAVIRLRTVALVPEHLAHLPPAPRNTSRQNQSRQKPSRPIASRPDPPGMRGAGDLVAAVFKATGVDAVAQAVARLTGRPCRCSERQAALNRLLPFR